MFKIRHIYRIVFLIVAFFIGGQLFSQLKRADEYFKYFEYAKAIPLYEKSLKKIDAKDTLHLIRLGVSYMRTNEYVKAEKIFEELVKIKGVNPNCYLYYGEVLHVNQKIEEAKAQFKLYTELRPFDQRGKELYTTTEKYHRNDTLNWVKVWNFDKVNTPYSEFSPILYKNGMVFTSDRKSGWLDDDLCGWTNRPYLSVFYCEIKSDSIDTIAKRPVPLDKRINTQSHNGIGTFNKGQDRFYFTRVDNKKSRDTNFVNQTKIYQAEQVGNKWKNIKGITLNHNDYSVEHPNLSPDGNKLFFVSDMPGGYGGKDIYCSEKEGESWGSPKNLGREVNSEGDEVFPFAKSSGVLYFSSNGHQGYGGLDIYVSSLQGPMWTNVVNMKLPLNSNYDDFGIAFFDKEAGYFSSNRINGFGNDDIYFFSFNRKELIITIENQKEFIPVLEASVFFMKDTRPNIDTTKMDSSGIAKFDGFERDSSFSTKPDVPYVAIKNRIDTSLHSKSKQLADLPVAINNWVPDSFELYFDYNKFEINAESEVVLDSIIKILKVNPNRIAEISTFADARGSVSYNDILTAKRSKSVKQFMVKHGVKSSNIRTISFGEKKIINQCLDGVDCGEFEHKLNRKCLIVLK